MRAAACVSVRVAVVPGEDSPDALDSEEEWAARSVIGPFVVPKHRELPGDSNDSVLSVELPATWEIGRRVRSLGRRRGGQEWDPNRGRITVLLSSTISCALRYGWLPVLEDMSHKVQKYGNSNVSWQ